MCGLAHIFSQSWSASSICHLLTHTCTNLHASTMIYMHSYTTLRVQRCAHKLQKCLLTVTPHALPILTQTDLKSEQAQQICTGCQLSPSAALRIRKKCEKSVWMCELSAPEDLGKSISISGGQKTQSDPCYTLTKVLIRISLKGRERRTSPAVQDVFGQEPVGRAHCSARLNSGERGDAYRRSFFLD